MKRIRWFLSFIALAALAASFVACGGGGEKTEATPTGTSAPAATATVAPEATATEAPAPTATEPSAPQPTEPDNTVAPVQVPVVAENLSFSPAAIQAPTNAPFTIVLDHRDQGVSHNIAIFADQSQAEVGNALFATPIEVGPVTQTLSVPSLAPGQYFVWCQVHRALMSATLTVQ